MLLLHEQLNIKIYFHFVLHCSDRQAGLGWAGPGRAGLGRAEFLSRAGVYSVVKRRWLRSTQQEAIDRSVRPLICPKEPDQLGSLQSGQLRLV